MVASNSLFLKGLASTTRWGDTSRISISWAVNPDMKTIGRLGRVIQYLKCRGTVLRLEDVETLTLQ